MSVGAEDLPDFLWVEQSTAPPPTKVRSAPDRTTAGWPGEPGLWVFIFGDMTLFGIFFVAFLAYVRRDRAGFANASQDLIRPIGVANTLILLTSSYLVVLAVKAIAAERPRAARRRLAGATACAVGFAALKAIEWDVALTGGHTPAQSRFYLFYFVLTGIHLLHVLIGVGLLVYLRRRAGVPNAWSVSRVGIESAAVYWHMVDLLWVVIFTLLYLVCVR